MRELDAFESLYALAHRLITGASKDEVAEAVRVLAPNFAGDQERYGALPFESLANMLRAEIIDPETAELMSGRRHSTCLEAVSRKRRLARLHRERRWSGS